MHSIAIHTSEAKSQKVSTTYRKCPNYEEVRVAKKYNVRYKHSPVKNGLSVHPKISVSSDKKTKFFRKKQLPVSRELVKARAV